MSNTNKIKIKKLLWLRHQKLKKKQFKKT